MAKYKKLRNVALLFVCLLATVGAGRIAADAPQPVVQSYGADSSLQKGLIVKLKEGDASKVVLATLATANKMQGVIVAPTDATVSLSPADSAAQQVYVATSGVYDTLVSSQGGPIKVGDYITISSLDGVGMKADTTESQVLGKAAAAFDGKQAVEGTATLKNQQGKVVTVSLARLPVNIQVAPNPLGVRLSDSVPNFLEKATQLVTDKLVSPLRIYLSLIILVATTIVATSLLYSGARNGMVAAGRNPLARRSIMRNLSQVVLVSVIIFIIGLFAVYLLLKL